MKTKATKTLIAEVCLTLATGDRIATKDKYLKDEKVFTTKKKF